MTGKETIDRARDRKRALETLRSLSAPVPKDYYDWELEYSALKTEERDEAPVASPPGGA